MLGEVHAVGRSRLTADQQFLSSQVCRGFDGRRPGTLACHVDLSVSALEEGEGAGLDALPGRGAGRGRGVLEGRVDGEARAAVLGRIVGLEAQRLVPAQVRESA